MTAAESPGAPETSSRVSASCVEPWSAGERPGTANEEPVCQQAGQDGLHRPALRRAPQ